MGSERFSTDQLCLLTFTYPMLSPLRYRGGTRLPLSTSSVCHVPATITDDHDKGHSSKENKNQDAKAQAPLFLLTHPPSSEHVLSTYSPSSPYILGSITDASTQKKKKKKQNKKNHPTISILVLSLN